MKEKTFEEGLQQALDRNILLVETFRNEVVVMTKKINKIIMGVAILTLAIFLIVLRIYIG